MSFGHPGLHHTMPLLTIAAEEMPDYLWMKNGAADSWRGGKSILLI
jgi:hypothetical protein